MSRTAIFDAIKAARGGKSYSRDEVRQVDYVLDQIGVPKGGVRALADPGAFFAGLRKAIRAALDQAQVDTVNALLAAASHWPKAWLAYGLATAWHEARMRPIEEYGKGQGRKYGAPGKHRGQIAYGRGLVQLTWDFNYEKADHELGLGGALIDNYALALVPDVATAILVRGMEEGWFTGKKLADYLPVERGTVEQFVQARRIINGTDKAQEIAQHAVRFQDALEAGGWK